MNGRKQTVQLTKEDALEVEQLFDSIKERLDKVETREEAVEIFNEAIIKLDTYGVLGGLSIEEAQKLVIGGEQGSRVMKLLEKTYMRNQGIFKRNVFCLVAGRTNYTLCANRLNPWLFYSFFWGGYFSILFAYILGQEHPELLPLLALGLAIAEILALLWQLSGYSFIDKTTLSIFNVFGVGFYYSIDDEIWYAPGWVKSIGLLGIKKWEGELLGNLPGMKIPYDVWIWTYPAIWGFNGIKIWLNEDGSEKSYLGFALAVGFNVKP